MIFDTTDETQRDLQTAALVTATGITYDDWATNNGITLNLTNQDICYRDGRLYLVNWAYSDKDARAVGIRTDENVIYQVDTRNDYAIRAFVVREPRQEMESMDFADDGEAYVLFNGGGRERDHFFIYRVLFDEKDLE